MKTETIKLIEALKSGITKEIGIESINVDGVKYRYDHYTNKYKSTPYFLETIFRKAVVASGKESFEKMFTDGKFSFYFDRAVLKGKAHGNITYKELVIL